MKPPPRNTAQDETNAYYAPGFRAIPVLKQFAIGIGFSLAAVVVIVAIQSLV